MAKRKTTTTGGGEGYKPRKQKTPEVDHVLDALVAQKAEWVPALQTRPRKQEGEISIVRVGARKNDASCPVFMQPYWWSASDSVRLKFVWFDAEKRSKQVEARMITFADHVLSDEPFQTQSANDRWPQSELRTTQWKKWLLFVWERTTGEELPIDKTTATKKRKRETKIMQTKEQDPKAKAPKKLLKRRDSVVSEGSDLNRPIKRRREVWIAYNEAEFDIDDDNAVRSARKAHRTLFKGDVHPSLAVLRAAYRERVQLRLSACDLTDAWLQFQTKESGSMARVGIDLTDYALLARGPLTTQRIAAASGLAVGAEDRDRTGIRAGIPSEDEAYRIVGDWMGRGRNFQEDGMDGVRLAKQVIEANVVRSYTSWLGRSA